jgi:hypothetical protein
MNAVEPDVINIDGLKGTAPISCDEPIVCCTLVEITLFCGPA